MQGYAAYEQDTLLFLKENYDYDLLDYLNDIQNTKKFIVLNLRIFGTLYFKN